ncbi:MAG TPA: FtsK/SpoIIIE domain-containing protein, partial [Herpetosiphonaceae bacterium]
MKKPIYIDRPPRIQPELPADRKEIPGPPKKEEDSIQRLIQLGLPMLTIVGYVMVSSFGGSGRSPLLMIPMALSVVASTSFGIYSYIREKNKKAEMEKAYADQLVEMNKEMHINHDMQRRFYRYNYPDVGTSLKVIYNARAEVDKTDRTLRTSARLWERRTSDADFGAIRLGMGTLPSTVVYELTNVDDFTDPQVREAMKLDADSRFVSDIPIIISLYQPPKEDGGDAAKKDENSLTPVTHSLGIAGDRQSVYEFIRGFLLHHVVFHAAMDSRLYVLGYKKEAWDWVEALPHSAGDEQNKFCCFVSDIKVDPNANPYDDDEGDEFDKYLEGIRKVLTQRKIRLEESDDSGKGNPTLPFLLVVIDLLDASEDTANRLGSLESDGAISILLEQGAMLGAAIIFLVPERGKVPSGCRSVLEIEKTSPATNSKVAQNKRLFFRYAESGVNSFRYVGEADFVVDQAELRAAAEELATLNVRQSAGANLVSAVLFLDLMGYADLQELKADSWRQWQDSEKPQYANWMRVKMGMMAGNKARTMVFSAKRDGTHGMVAGSTGSGKSELLISMITAMAVTYNPSVLNFVLVDYKGGGAFKEFEALPHCVDIITNLAGDGVTRMFTAINAEMKRRQALNADTGTKNIVEYRQKGLHLTHMPYPFLFIIVDEFAEMIADRAEYKGELESITRVGRAQGVSLILAAQRPSGISDQMRSNIKFRISLRVETAGESREMLRRSDAAYLPNGIPGRGYLQVGNEEIELIQVAYSGAPYIDPTRPPVELVIWPDRGGGSREVALDQTPPELYKAIIDALNMQHKEHGLPIQRAPWPDFLSRNLSLSQTLIASDQTAKALTFKEYLVGIEDITLGQPNDGNLSLNPSITSWLSDSNGWVENLDWSEYAMRPVVGLIDNPYAAKQIPLVIDFPRGHMVMFGASGWGKTTFIRSLIVSLAATHSPNHFHAYILDLGGRNLGILDKLPHVGAVVIPDEEGYVERVEQLLREIEDIVDKRKTLLTNASLPDVYQYNKLHPENLQPAIVMAIDNFLEFNETFGGQEEGVETAMDKFIGLARLAKPYGIHFVITIGRLSDLSNQLFSLFTERYTLKLSDHTDYRTIAGGAVSEIADIPGRGYTKVGINPLSFQVAVPFDLTRADGSTGNESKEIEQLAGVMNDYIARSGRKYRLPVRVDPLPKAVLFKQLLAREFGLDLDATFLPRFKEITRQRWAQSASAEHADWLKVTIGVMAGNRPRVMSLEAKKDGVHGLIAGGTGAGKSELLMTLILGLALNYDPSILNFVLVDYKGGGAFMPFTGLPHTVDMITNLNKSAVRRFFTAINAEMQRRQRMNAETGTKDIVEYRQKGLHLVKDGYPHLFIIIDEYAEMISDTPEFKDELESITRVGRAQGVNLLLAAQRPVGVTDQMRANIKFRICLRVEGVDTSREMLRRSDAAYLPNGMPGRGYIQVGNENIELVQVSYTGENYDYVPVPDGAEKPKFYDVIREMANEILNENKHERPMTPWPPFLPSAITFNDPLSERYLDPAYRGLITWNQPGQRLTLNPALQDWKDGKAKWHGVDWDKTAMRGIPGLLDDPYNAKQMPLIVDLTRGHAVLFGASGWGKTTLIRALIMSLAATHSPNEFNAHILDLGGRNLESLRALPQVGTIIMPDEQGYEERVQQLWRELNDVADQRKKLFSESGSATLYEYNAVAAKPEPAMLIVIDNFLEYIETFGDGGGKKDENSMMEAFINLARQGKAYGLHFLITATRLSVLNSKLYSLFTERLTLRLADNQDYPSIVGSQIGDIEEVAGRGYVRVGRTPLAFQIALPPGSVDAHGQVRGEAGHIRAIGKGMTDYIASSGIKFREPLRIGALPKTSSFRQVLTEMHEIPANPPSFVQELKDITRRVWDRNRSAEHADWLAVTLGIASGNRKRTIHMEAKKDGVHGMIAGGTGAGKSELLMTLIVGLALNYSPDILNFVLIDYKGGGAFKPFENLPHCVDIVTNLNKAAVNRMFTSIAAEIRRRQALNAETGTKDIVEYREKGLHLTREPYPHLFVIADEYAEMLDDSPEYLPALESITRVGRAQGVNLILAAQRPKGVSDQMRANIKLRMCLRVEQVDTSREMLRRPDAALLPNGMPGRGYIQVGNENLELIQMSYTGENQPDDRPHPVNWPERPVANAASNEDLPKLFDMVVQISGELVDWQPTPKPWPNFLPEVFSLQSPIINAQTREVSYFQMSVTDWLNDDTSELWQGVDWRNQAMRPAVLLVDNPWEASQEQYEFDLTRNHLIIMGDSGWGKTSLVRTIITSLAATHSPDELHVYVLDLGGRNYRNIEALPHVGTAVYADEETFDERMGRLLDRINRIADERQQIFSEADATSLYDYNERYPDKRLPAVLVAIDNYAVIH